MKVKELIEKLEKFDPEQEVVLQYDESGWYGTDSVTEETGEEDTLVSINWGK